MKKISFLFLFFSLIAEFTPAQTGVEFSIRLNPDGITYEAYMRPNVNWSYPNNITGTGQFSVKAPTGTLVVAAFLNNDSYAGSGSWQANQPVVSPPEAPDYDYFPFGYNGGSRQYPFSPGAEVLLFSFNNGIACGGSVEVIDNFSDPFATNQSSINIGNSLVTFGSQNSDNGSGSGNAWYDNYNPVQGCSLLPIDLISFEVHAEDCDNRISWTTATEEGVDYYEVTRSEDGVNFEEIGRVVANGGSNGARYELMDKNANRDYYYRLKSVDFDERSEIHPLVFVKSSCCFKNNKEDFLVTPNPSIGYSVVQFNWCSTDQFSSMENNQVAVRVYDHLGRMAYSMEIDEVSDGFNQHNLDFSQLPPAVYFIRIESANWQSDAKKIVKM